MAQSRDKLRLMTLNTHSLMEPDNDFCLHTLARAIVAERVDIVALQEVNQEMTAVEAPQSVLAACNYQACGSDRPVRSGNFALLLAQRLKAMGEPFAWTWSHAHCGYGRYDEGLALLSREPMEEALTLGLSTPQGRCRRIALGARLGGRTVFSVHMGWWKDEEDPFALQWAALDRVCRERNGAHYLMGDFNSPAHVRGEGYDLICAAHWQDCYLRAENKDTGNTVGGCIDGWRKGKVDPMRIDFVLTDAPGQTVSSRVIFNGDFYPVISDHYGVLTEEGVAAAT